MEKRDIENFGDAIVVGVADVDIIIIVVVAVIVVAVIVVVVVVATAAEGPSYIIVGFEGAQELSRLSFDFSLKRPTPFRSTSTSTTSSLSRLRVEFLSCLRFTFAFEKSLFRKL